MPRRRIRGAVALLAAMAMLLGTSATSVLAVPTAVTLNVVQVSQLQGNWCGPAVAYSILKYYGDTKSKWDGATLSQSALSKPAYTGAGATGGTSWAAKAMPRALNRWHGGSSYFQEWLGNQTSGRLRSIVVGDIGGSGRPLVAETTEYATLGAPHYNYHPNRKVYHWIGIRGYSDNGSTIGVFDPAAGSGVAGYEKSLRTFNINLDTLFFYIVINEQQYEQDPAGGRGVVW